MTTFIDIIMSVFVFGVLVLSLGRININMNNAKATNQFSYTVQSNSIELARHVEHDFAKIGYHATGQKITAADSTSITFNADLDNTNVSTLVQYTPGTPDQMTATSNPHDFSLFRTVSGQTTNINYGLILFNLKYYDDHNVSIPTPITTVSDLNNIRSIRIRFIVQSPETIPLNTVWESVTWEKTILPRNLSNLNY